MATRKRKPLSIPVDESFNEVGITALTKTLMTEYASKVNMDRAIPDFRDGLKPVQRKIMYASYKHLGGGKAREKSAKVIGLVIGNYHPHGDTSAYGALVTMVGQPTPAFVGIGGWSTQIDPPSAMRYTECHLSHYGRTFFDPNYIVPQVTDYVPNYDRKTVEPLLLPSLLPNIFFNGTQGIGVGVRTGIPSFTPTSVLSVLISILKNEKPTTDNLASRLRFYEPWGGWVDTKDKVVRAQIRSLMKSTTGKVDYCSVISTDRNKKTMVIEKFAPGVNIDNLVKKLRTWPEITSVIPGDPAPVGFQITFKPSINYNEYDKLVAKITQLTKGSLSFSITVTERLPLAKEGDVPLGISRDDYQVRFYQLTIPQLMIKWLRWRIELETKSLQYQVTVSRAKIALHKLMILATDNLDIIRDALRSKDPWQHLIKHLKITKDQADTILQKRVIQLSRMSRSDIVNKLKAELQHLKGLKIRLSNPKKEVINFLQLAKDKFEQVETPMKAMCWILPDMRNKETEQEGIEEESMT
jgi:DNA gyrase/topoisomerase IV subunit A